MLGYENGIPYTTCKDCIFRIRSPHESCMASRVEKFTDKVLDDDSGSYRINGRLCLMYRAENNRCSLDEARSAIALKCDIIILTDVNTTLDDLKRSIKEAASQSLPATTLSVVLNNASLRPGNVIDIIKSSLTTFNWRVKQILDRGPEGAYLPDEDCVDMDYEKCEGGFFLVVKPYHYLPPNTLEKIDRSINDDLQQFCLLKGQKENWSGSLFQKKLYKNLNGNKPFVVDERVNSDGVTENVWCDNIIDKIEYFAEKNGMPYMVKNMGEVCPEF